MGNPQMYCSICGAPMLESGTTLRGSPIEWLTNAILLTTAHNTDNGVELDAYWPWNAYPRSLYAFHLGPNPPKETQRSVLRLDAHAHGTSQFDILGSSKRVNAMCVEIEQKTPAIDRGGPLYLPVHRLCLQLADCFINSIGTSMQMSQVLLDDRITSIKQLWEVLYRRLHGSIFPSIQTWELPEPHDYFGGRRCRNVYWEAGDDPDHGELHEQNPIEIPNLTEEILQNLKLIPVDNPEGVTCNEIQDSAAQEAAQESAPAAYHILQNLDLNCDYLRSQDWWLEALVNKEMFPWLWDLDVSVVRERQRAGRWNWELLARQLSQTKIHEPNDTSLRLPLPLRNRRRIWRLLEEARVDDIAAPEGRAMAARRDEQRRHWAMQPPLPANFKPLPFPISGFKYPEP